MELDNFDRQLLNLLQDDAAATADKLAIHVPLSASAIQRRVRRLRESGAIEREVAVVDLQHVGPVTVFIASLHVERERPDLMAAVRKWLVAEASVQQVYYVTGAADFVIVVSAPDVQTYNRLMTRLLVECPGALRFETNVALDVIKRGLAIPLDP